MLPIEKSSPATFCSGSMGKQLNGKCLLCAHIASGAYIWIRRLDTRLQCRSDVEVAAQSSPRFFDKKRKFLVLVAITP